jgi:ribonuclease BN (tRNA processing enzyme)
MKAVLLGSGGWIPTSSRETCCVYVRKERDVLFLDAGTGLRRAVEQSDLLADVREAHVLLSHFHLDHVVGLGYLPGLELAEPPVVWGPGEALYGESTRSILSRLLEPPLYGGLEYAARDVRELVEGENRCGSFVVRARRQQRHTDPTFGFRVDDALTYCSDTAADEGSVDLADGCSALLHEAWSAAGGVNDDIHASAREAADIAQRAGVRRLFLIHVHPLGDDTTLEEAAHATFARSTLGRDLLEIELDELG